MRTKSSSKAKSISLKKKLSELKIFELAKQTRFQLRKPKKIFAIDFICSFFDCCFGPGFSLTNWSVGLGARIGETVSKQAVSERANDNFIELLNHTISKSLNKPCGRSGGKILKRFNNVYVQDSSCLGLPDALKDIFRGNFSNGQIKSVAKLQVIFNLAKGMFSSLTLNAYSRNDQAASQDIIPLLRKGDLVIRDMGYFVVEALLKIKERRAEFISRLKIGIKIFDASTGRHLNLAGLLKGKTYLKKRVLIGAEEKIPVFLMAIKTTNEIRYDRIKRLRHDRDKRIKITWEKTHTFWVGHLCMFNG